MLKFVSENTGNPNNTNYWEYANQTLNLNHSIDSLRAHWKTLLNRNKPSLTSPKSDLEKREKREKQPPTTKRLANEEDYSAGTMITPTSALDSLSWIRNSNLVTKAKEDGVCIKSIGKGWASKDDGVKENVVVKRKVIIEEDCVVKIKAENSGGMDYQKIEKMFITLVELCGYKIQRSVSPRLVAKVLVQCKGNVQDTLELFLRCNT